MDETTSRLAAFGAGLDVIDIPDEVIDRVKRLFADAIASALAGWSSPQSGQIAATAARLYGSGSSTVIGGGTTSMGAAVLVNGYLTTARSVCDVHQPTLCHVTPVVLPPILCLAEAQSLDGASVLAALASGMEVTVRIGLGLEYTKFRTKGWHSPGVSALIGAALGASRALGLEADSAERAMGIAASQAGGTFASYGTPTIKFHQARAAQGALLAASLVVDSFQGPTAILTNPDGGVFTTFSDGGDLEAAVGGLGERWELMEITTRLWPAAAALQSILTIVDEETLPDSGEIDEVEVTLPPKSYEMNAGMGWETVFQATLSARFATALAIHGVSLWRLTSETLRDPGVNEFARTKMSVALDPSLPEGAARLTASSGGHVRSWGREHPRGSPTSPASWDDVSSKMHIAGDGVVGESRVDFIVSQISELERITDVSGIVAATQAVTDG